MAVYLARRSSLVIFGFLLLDPLPLRRGGSFLLPSDDAGEGADERLLVFSSIVLSAGYEEVHSRKEWLAEVVVGVSSRH